MRLGIIGFELLNPLEFCISLTQKFFQILVQTNALHFRIHHSRVPADYIPAVSALVPVHTDVLRIHRAGHPKIWHTSWCMAGYEANQQMPPVPPRGIRSRPVAILL